MRTNTPSLQRQYNLGLVDITVIIWYMQLDRGVLGRQWASIKEAFCFLLRNNLYSIAHIASGSISLRNEDF